MNQQISDIKIYVACLAAYNSGHLHGTWIDATQSADEIHKDIQAMLKASPIENAEEFAIHDCDGFEGVSISEYSGIEEVAELAEFIEEHGALGGELIAHFNDLDHARETIEEHYHGEYSSLADFAQELTEETTQIPDNLAYYIDYEAMSRDLEINDVFAIEISHNEVHVFWRH
ncbi:MAG: antirestriction protein ArdA [Rhizobiales bacterium]|nr:antirestriction protein ArdA [Hyphomicrobiales bacterium]